MRLIWRLRRWWYRRRHPFNGIKAPTLAEFDAMLREYFRFDND